nr:hypothetical protein BaRGS_011758 [Batillaria attramentaria]
MEVAGWSLEVQGRTSKLQGFNVTVFTAFALKNENDPPVEVQHADNSGNGQLKVLLNGTEFLDNDVMEDNTYLEKLDSGKDVQIILTSGVSIMDFLVTNDNDTALATKTTLVEVQDMQSLLAAKPPEFDNPQES